MNTLSLNCIWALALSAVVLAAPSIEQEGVVDLQPPPIVEKDVVDGLVDAGDDTRDGVLDNSGDIYRMEGTIDVGYLERDRLPLVLAASQHVVPAKDDVAEGTVDLAYAYLFAKPQKATIDDLMPVEFFEPVHVADQ